MRIFPRLKKLVEQCDLVGCRSNSHQVNHIYCPLCREVIDAIELKLKDKDYRKPHYVSNAGYNLD